MRLLNCKFHGVGNLRPDPKWHLAPHAHPFHQVIVVLKGRLLLNPGKGQITAKKGDVLFYRSGFVHEEVSEPQAPVSTVFFSFETSDLLPWVPVLLHDAHGRIRQIVHWMLEDEYARRGPEALQPLLEVLLGEMRRLCDAPPDPWLESVLTYIRKNMSAPLTLDDLARCGKMSRFAFVRKFKRHCGRTPMQELRLTRLDQARTLLLSTRLAVKEIAPAVGIGDEYQLSKLFRAQFGLSPRNLRAGRIGAPQSW